MRFLSSITRLWLVDLYDGDCDYPFDHVIFFFRKSAEKYVSRNEEWFKENHIRVVFGGEHLFFKSFKIKE